MPCRMILCTVASVRTKSWINSDKIWLSALKYWWMMSFPTQKHFPLNTQFLLKMCHVMEVKFFVIVILRSLFCKKIQAVITFQPFLFHSFVGLSHTRVHWKNSHTEQMVGDVWLVNCSRCKTSHTAHLMLETLMGYFILMSFQNLYDFLSSMEHMDYLCVIFGAQQHPFSFPFVLHRILLCRFATRPVVIVN